MNRIYKIKHENVKKHLLKNRTKASCVEFLLQIHFLKGSQEEAISLRCKPTRAIV